MMDPYMIIEYLKRSYFALDGLWFVMMEEEFSFEEALKIDKKVWEVLPKIQARKAEELLGISGNGMKDLLEAITIKMQAEGHNYEVLLSSDDLLEICIHECQWYNLLKRSKREHIAPQIAENICFVELNVWLSEFCDNGRLELNPRICEGASQCVIKFQAL